MLNQQVTKDFILRQLDQLPPDGLAEVARFIEFLQFQPQQPTKKARATHTRTAFGLWANRPEAQDPARYAETLRQKLEKRQDG